jgi:hypothetical protein
MKDEKFQRAIDVLKMTDPIRLRSLDWKKPFMSHSRADKKESWPGTIDQRHGKKLMSKKDRRKEKWKERKSY